MLVGRNPDSKLLTVTRPAGESPPTVVQVDAASVSSNHLLAWVDGDSVCLEDLGSRNGSWLKLPSAKAIRTESEVAVVQLARASRESSSSDEPPAPVWHGNRGFGSSLRDALEQWLGQQGIGAD